jgi:ACS family sodium-dependent inorganic phosphate cotransporter-like MFS transporter 5
MVKETNHTDDELSHNTCEISPESVNITKAHAHGSYDWDARTQGIILGAFFYTYTVMQIPSGRVAEEFGGRWVVSFSLLGSGILNLLTPLLTSSVSLMVVSRVTLGLLQCGLFPACFSIIFNWFPQKERSIGYSIMEIGTMLGSVWAAAMAGYLAEHGFAGGWPSTFYISGVIAIIAACVWTPYVTSTPEEHWMISVSEVKYIRRESTKSGNEITSKRRKKRRPVPWKAIFSNEAVLANVFSKFFLRWTFYTLVMKLPTYLNDVLHMSPTKNGIVNASMYLVSMVPMLFVGYASEQLISRKIVNRTQCRKLFIGAASLGSAICLACVPSFGCNSSAVIGLLLVGNLFQALDAAGNIPNPGELSKNYATTVFAIVNMLNTSTGFIVPYLIGLILENGKGRDPIQVWSIVFYLASGLALLSGLIYGLFGSGERQAFDYDDEAGDEDVEESLLSDPEVEDGVETLTEQLLQQHSPVRRLTTN